jgi:uncharacterized protein YggT (Ycf19 family)
MNQTPGGEGYGTSPNVDPEAERIEKRVGLVRKIKGFIWFLCGFIEVIIGARVVLKLIGADPLNSFTNFIYDISYPFVAPFFGIVTEPAANGGVLEAGSLIAMAVYLFIAWGLVRLIELIMLPTQVDHV